MTTDAPRVAALFVHRCGVYWGDPTIDAWDRERDARLYAGPHPVVAHPPCERWGRYATARGQVKGDDGGCFAAALDAVRRYGGVLEHPEASAAWAAFGLCAPPAAGGWVAADWCGGWTCAIEQGRYGHRSQKRSWLYVCGVGDLPSLRWGRSARGRASDMAVQRLGRRARLETPLEFRDLLLAIAESAGNLAGNLAERAQIDLKALHHAPERTKRWRKANRGAHTMPRDARITDVCDHGPQIITGAASVIDEGQPTSRIGDIYDCPVHGPNPIITGAPQTVVAGSKTSRIGDVTECGAVIVTGAQRCEV